MQRKIRRGPARQRLQRDDFRLTEEVRSIQHRAAEREGRIVSIGPLVLFSTQTGDAWILDPADQLAARLARDGDPLVLYVEETDTSMRSAGKDVTGSTATFSSTRTTNRAGSPRSEAIQHGDYYG
jgi:hypothetical protein